MLIIRVKEGESVDRALRRYKRKFKDAQILRELRSRQSYTKPSARRRLEIDKARYQAKMRSLMDK
ncbi:MAG: 30S ribosomal protein S21 [Bacteroidota bacterium]